MLKQTVKNEKKSQEQPTSEQHSPMSLSGPSLSRQEMDWIQKIQPAHNHFVQLAKENYIASQN